MNRPIILSGPSGVGKTKFCEYLQEKGWLYLEADVPPRDGIDELDLRRAWNSFWEDRSPHLLAEELRNRRLESCGVILSLPSQAIADISLIEQSEPMLKVRFLWGDPRWCLRDFLERERRTGRNLGIDHWKENNSKIYLKLRDLRYERYLVNVFEDDGTRKPLRQVEKQICS